MPSARLLLVALIAAVLAAGPNGFDRLRSAFSPAASSAPSLLRLDAWVTPPVYTEVPPIVLADGSETVGAGSETFRALSVPERSELIVRAHVPKGEKVSLVTSNEDGTVAKAVEPKTGHAEGLIEFTVTLNDPGSADVQIGGQTVAKWRFDLIKDEAPTISLMGNPTTTPRGALRLIYRADDDHGVANAEAKIRPRRGRRCRPCIPPPAPSHAGAISCRPQGRGRHGCGRQGRKRQGQDRSLARAAGHAAAIAARQREARRRACHPGPDGPSLGGT